MSDDHGTTELDEDISEKSTKKSKTFARGTVDINEPVKKWPTESDDEAKKYDSQRKVLNVLRSPMDVIRNDWRAFMAEFVATMMFVFLSTGLIVSYYKDKTEGGDLGAGLVSIAFGIGISLSTMIYTVANISGGHLNPAVTVSLFLIRQIELFKAIGYIICQLLGGIVGTALMYGVMPDNVTEQVHMGATALGYGVTPAEGCAIETCLTFILVFTVCATAELSGDLKHMGRFAPLVIGYAVLVDHMVGVPFTGASMNPARSFGPAVVGNYWVNHWVYWVGPMVGGIIASVTYHYLFILKD